MSAPSSAVPGSASDSHRIASAATPTRPLYWSVRRELWENRSITVAPLLVAGIVLVGSFISVIVMAHRTKSLPPLEQASRHVVAVRPFNMAPAPIMLAALLVGVFYALEALHGERRDRSILFWKSQPVSDLTTVLSKASIPLVVLPLIAYGLGVVTQVGLLIPGAAILAGSGVSAAGLWAELRFFQGLVVMFYGLAAHVLWFAPIYCWLLLVSAWARRTPVLWATLPLLAVAVLERMAFNTTYFVSLLGYRVIGAMAEAFTAEVNHGNADRVSQLDPIRFLGTPGLWMGLAFAASCFAAAVRLRRYREPI